MPLKPYHALAFAFCPFLFHLWGSYLYLKQNLIFIQIGFQIFLKTDKRLEAICKCKNAWFSPSFSKGPPSPTLFQESGTRIKIRERVQLPHAWYSAKLFSKHYETYYSHFTLKSCGSCLVAEKELDWLREWPRPFCLKHKQSALL